MFNVIQETSNYFSTSAIRSACLSETIEELESASNKKKIQPLCPTRWVQRHDAVITFKELIGAVCPTLEKMASSKNDSKATCLNISIHRTQFVVALVVVADVSGLLVQLSKQLQSAKVDLNQACSMVLVVRETLQDKRRAAGQTFARLFEEVKSKFSSIINPSYYFFHFLHQSMFFFEGICTNLDIEMRIPRTTVHQKNRANVSADTPEEYFRRTCYIPFLDELINVIDKRFTEHFSKVAKLSLLIPSNCGTYLREY